MKWIRYEYQETVAYGFIENNRVFAVENVPFGGIKQNGGALNLSQVRLLAPCLPSKIICLGLNYLDHAKEMRVKELPEEPLLFLKPPTALLDPDAAIIHPESSSNLHYEGELALVIGKQGKAISRSQAEEYVFGYTCANDVTARDLQKKDGQWTRGKSFDTFCPLGPCIETDFDHTRAAIQTRLNGVVRQSSNIDQLIFKVPELVEFVSQVMTLYPGDIILTGTAAGVGQMVAGDVVEVEIEGIGTLKNTVISL